MKRLFLYLILLVCFPLGAMADQERELAQAIAKATNPSAKGLAIAKMADYRDTGWHSSEVKMVMTLRNRRGQESKRRMRNRAMEVSRDGDKSLSIFDTPRDIKGTAMLTWSHALEPDDQWIYLPALKRVKRISSRNKSGPFMGSEFAYEDLSSQEVEKYGYTYLKDDVVNGMDCYVIERKPAYKYSGYTRQISWLDKKHFNTHQIVFYDRKKAPLKTLTFTGYKPYIVNGKTFWRAGKMFMKNRQTRKNTTLNFQQYRFNKRFTKRDFDRSTLKRVR